MTTTATAPAPLVRMPYGDLEPGDVIAAFGTRLPVLAVGAALYTPDLVVPLVTDAEGDVTPYGTVSSSLWVAIEPRPDAPRFVCGACKMLHMRVADARACYEDRAAEAAAELEGHFCESPSCVVEAGCAGYRYDSSANGYWGQGEEDRERAAWALEDARREGLEPVFLPPPPVF